MITVLSDFNRRVNEIDEYLKLLNNLSEPDMEIHIAGKKARYVELLALKTMKASCFLLLYNLVESSIRGSMSKIYEKMNNEEKDLSKFDPFVKEIWIKQQFKKLEPVSTNQVTYRKLVWDMVDLVLKTGPVLLDIEEIQISGNLDARSIRKLFEEHKISTVTHYRAFRGAELVTIKDKRNSLAHGEISFADCGQEYTVSDLQDIKKQAVIYLRSSLKNIVKYIENTKYAA